MKKGLIGLFISFFLISFASAQFYGGFGNPFYTPNWLDLLIVGVVFIIFFGLINFSLARSIFRNQPRLANIISAAVTILIIVGIYRSNFNLTGFFYGFGIDEGILYPLLSLVILIGVIFLIGVLGKRKDEYGENKFSFKRGLGWLLILGGIFLILITTLTDIFYEEGIPFVLGIIAVLIGWFVRRERRNKGQGGFQGNRRGFFGFAKNMYEKGRNYVDPRSKLDRFDRKRKEKIEKRIAKENLQRQKEIDSAHGRALRENEERDRMKRYQEEQKRMMEENKKYIYGKMQEKAYEENRRRDQIMREMNQISQEMNNIKNELVGLQSRIPNVSIKERGKIENQIKKLYRQGNKLEKEYLKLEKELRKISG